MSPGAVPPAHAHRQQVDRAAEYFQMAINFYGSRYQRSADLDRSMDITVQTLLYAHRKVCAWRAGAGC